MDVSVDDNEAFASAISICTSFVVSAFATVPSVSTRCDIGRSISLEFGP